MAFTVSILSGLVLFFLWGSIPRAGDVHLAAFRSPVFLALAALLCVVCLVCVARRGRWKRPGFVLCHVAIVLICAGAFIGYRYGERASFRVPVMDGEGADRLPKSDGTYVTMPFKVAVPEAKADYYPPTLYGMYAPPEYDLVGEVKVRSDGMLDLPQERHPAPEALRDAAGNYAPQIILADGNMLQMVTPTVKHYQATLKFVHKDSPSDYQSAAVNHPVSYQGWRFYLMDYGTDPYLNVSFAVRRDPGRRLVIVGIWLLIFGTAWLCWRPRRRAA